jgi:2,3-bisphosphoglycerate-dependent phosphoglycerate mutase
LSAEAPATRIVLVRHGESRCNVDGIVGGDRGCTGLTGRGADQVAALATRLVATGELAGTTALYASTLPRAIETAEILRPALEATNGGRALDIVVDRDLRELEPGEADGLAWTDVYERWGPFNLDVVQNPWVPGGETWLDFVARVERAVTSVADAHPGELVVIACHGGVVGGTMTRFLPIAPGVDRLELAAKNASMTEWARTDGRWMLVRYNDGGEPSAPVVP